MQLLHTSERKGRESFGGDASGSQRSHWDVLITEMSPGATRGVAQAAPRSCPRQDHISFTTSFSAHIPPARSRSNVLPPAQEPPYTRAHPTPPPASLANRVALVTVVTRPTYGYYMENYVQSTTLTQGLCSF